jgi:hypothetical protein
MPPVGGKPGPKRRTPERLQGDRGYDSEAVRVRMRWLGITPVLAERYTESGSGLGCSAGSWSGPSPGCMRSGVCDAAWIGSRRFRRTSSVWAVPLFVCGFWDFRFIFSERSHGSERVSRQQAPANRQAQRVRRAEGGGRPFRRPGRPGGGPGRTRGCGTGDRRPPCTRPLRREGGGPLAAGAAPLRAGAGDRHLRSLEDGRPLRCLPGPRPRRSPGPAAGVGHAGRAGRPPLQGATGRQLQGGAAATDRGRQVRDASRRRWPQRPYGRHRRRGRMGRPASRRRSCRARTARGRHGGDGSLARRGPPRR